MYSRWIVKPFVDNAIEGTTGDDPLDSCAVMQESSSFVRRLTRP